MYLPKTKEEAIMELHFNVTKEQRKEMVSEVSRIIMMAPVYKGVPTCSYAVGNYIITKDGTLVFDERVETSEVNKIVEALKKLGFETEDKLEEVPEPETTEESDSLIVEVPADKVNVENIKRLLEAKGKLIKKALGAGNLEIEVTQDTVRFPWFEDLDPEKAMAYTNFIAALCQMSVNQTRISAKETEVPNEKYAFRCFLLRLGFIGDEYKKDRKILLENLDGNSAFRQPKGGDEA